MMLMKDSRGSEAGGGEEKVGKVSGSGRYVLSCAVYFNFLQVLLVTLLEYLLEIESVRSRME